MIIRLSTNRLSTSNWVTLFFLIVLVISGIFSEFFQAPSTVNKEFSKYHYLYHKEEIANIEKISLHNRLGDFDLTRKSFENPQEWRLTSPRDLPASYDVIENILNTLEAIKIRKIFTKDSINLANFSLDSPMMKLDLFRKGAEKVTISFGLVNPIDNSTYLMASDKDVIYHIDSLNSSVEKLGLSDFVDSKVFTINKKNIQYLKIFRGENLKAKPQLLITQDKEGFKNESKELLEPEKINAYFDELLSLKSHFILDKVSEKLKTTLDKVLAKPFYTLVIKTKDDLIYTYQITSILSSLPDLKIEKRQNFIIKSSNREHPTVLDKTHFTLFGKRKSSFKRLQFKKLFY